MDELRIINFLDAFIANALSIIIPLLLVAKGVDVVQIGLVVSMSPVIFVVSRSIFAAMSDQVGVRKFFILNGAMNVVSVLIYLVASNPFLFSIGKMFEGVRNGAMWSVNRTAVFMRNGRKAVDEMSRTQAIRVGAAAMGIIVAGVLLDNYSFDAALIFFIILGVILFSVSFLVEGGRSSKIRIKEIFGQLDFRRKSEVLKRTSLVMIPQSVAIAIPLSLIFPLFLKDIGYDYWLIGVAIALYYAISAITTFLYMRMKWGKGAMWVGALAFLAGGILLPLLDGAWALPLMAVMGIGDGMATPLWEALVFNATGRSRNVSSDIALLHTPPNLSNAVCLIAAGVI
ncbi:MAG: MFS transporter, partial [Candidatus Micrarchaeota archaeon]|nr:MFS transporter [Candidatus Micrarchaeota archaeon]